MLTVFAFSVVGIYGLASALQGCMERPMGLGVRAMALLAGGACLWPSDMRIQIAGALVVLVLLALNTRGVLARPVPEAKPAA